MLTANTDSEYSNMHGVNQLLCFNSVLYCIRPEFFGGLLINRSSMVKYQVSMLDAMFLLLVKHGVLVSNALSIISKEQDISFIPDLDFYQRTQVLIENNISETDSTSDSASDHVIEGVLEQVYRARSKNHLSCPLEVTIYPTLRCQLSCEFCFLGAGRFLNMKEHDALDWVRLIRSFADAGVCSVSVLGGEPSLYPDIASLIEGIDEIGVKCTITTNGQSWSSDSIRAVIASKNVTPVVSLESLDQTYGSRILRSNYSVKKAVDLIQTLRDHGKNCRVNAVYYKQSKEQLFELVDFCAGHSIQKLSLALFSGVSSCAPSIRETNDMGHLMKQYARSSSFDKLYISVEGCMLYSSHTDLDGSVVDSDFQLIQYGCECGNTILEILPDGSLYPCAALIPLIESFGNAFLDVWQDLWMNSEQLSYFRTTRCTDSVCRTCSLYKFCNGGCPAFKICSGHDEPFQAGDSRCLIHQEIEANDARKP